jgi:hypothetical protein
MCSHKNLLKCFEEAEDLNTKQKNLKWKKLDAEITELESITEI